MQNVERKTWKELKDTKLLWWINRSLHLFGWAIAVVEESDGTISDCFPIRVSYRGFSEEVEEEGFKELTNYLFCNVGKLVKDQIVLPANPPRTYQKKIMVEAIQWTGDNFDEMHILVKLSSKLSPGGGQATCSGKIGYLYSLQVPSGEITAKPGDWVIKDKDGNYSICDREKFKNSYEKI